MILKKTLSNIRSAVNLCIENRCMSVFVVGIDEGFKDYIYNLFESSKENIADAYESGGWLEIRLKNGSFLHACEEFGIAKRCRYNIILADTKMDEKEYCYVLFPLIANYSFRGYE